MNNVYLELIPAGSSSRIVVRPLSSSLAAFGFLNLKAHVKVFNGLFKEVLAFLCSSSLHNKEMFKQFFTLKIL